MKKKYSDPLMFSSALLTTIPVDPSDSGVVGPDEPWDEDDNNANSLYMNASPAKQSSAPVSIVNPVEEAMNSTEASPEKAPGNTTSTHSPLEVESVINEIVTDESATSVAAAGE